MKGQVPPEASGQTFANGGHTYRFNPRNAEDIFAEFFGESSPFAGMAGMGNKGGRPNPFGDHMFGGFGGESVFRSFNDASGGGPSSGPRKAPPVENKLHCTLEEIYSGSTRKMKISRNVVDASGYVFHIVFFMFRIIDM